MFRKTDRKAENDHQRNISKMRFDDCSEIQAGRKQRILELALERLEMNMRNVCVTAIRKECKYVVIVC